MTLNGAELVEVIGSLSGGSARASATSETVTTAAIAALANTGQVMTPQSIDGILFADQYASIQAAHDALPATGGVIVLPPAGTYVQQSEIVISKSNVMVLGQGFGTVLQRGTSLTGTATVIRVTGSNCLLTNFTVDGNGANVTPTGADVGIDGAGSAVERLQIINGSGLIQLRLNATGARASFCVITGRGVSNQCYGIWAIGHVPVMINNNKITNTGIDGIGFDGAGTQVIGNYLAGCHCYTGGSGGQIVSYPISGASAASDGALIANNVVLAGGAATSSGIEIHSGYVTVIGNTVQNQASYGIILFLGGGTNITGNTVRNSGLSGSIDGISIQAGATDFKITGNVVTDDQGGSATQRYGIRIEAGASDRFVITGNTLAPNKTGALFNAATGLNQTIGNNRGVDDVIPSLASAGTITLPVNPTIALTGSVNVTAIAAAASWTGRDLTFIPNGAVVFTGGSGAIGNTLTTVANVPTTAVFNGANWYLK